MNATLSFVLLQVKSNGRKLKRMVDNECTFSTNTNDIMPVYYFICIFLYSYSYSYSDFVIKGCYQEYGNQY